jgi:hypothetical protein
LERNFTASDPDERWAGDLSELHTASTASRSLSVFAISDRAHLQASFVLDRCVEELDLVICRNVVYVYADGAIEACLLIGAATPKIVKQ